MFEQATLTNGPAGKRVWSAFLGLTSQATLVGLAVLAPMIWPQAMPANHLWETIMPPLPPGPKVPVKEAQPPRAKAVVQRQFIGTVLQMPTSFPAHPMPILDPDDAVAGPTVVGVPEGMSGPANSGVENMLRSLAASTTPVERPVTVVKPAAVPAAPKIERHTIGGNVHLGEPLVKAAPQYPSLAKAAHVFGDVNLECVVGIDGRIKEVKPLSGNPLLLHAAEEAAWKWVYAPSKLNGVPIEIVTVLTFNFKLN